VWRLGVPAMLMVAFALVGLTTKPWRADEAPRPTRGGAVAIPFGSRTPGPRRLVTVAAQATPAAPAVASDEPTPLEAGHPGSAPEFRLPEELQPVGPDVVVAMQAEEPKEHGVPRPAHAHVDTDAHDPFLVADGALAAPAGDDVQGPEPGAVFWFGPHGLERIRPLGVALR
jgi:hypothetical protein